MTLFEAIVLGIVQGLTEFLPISSTAHLLVVPKLLGWGDPGAAFSAVIQIGTLAAVLVYFASDIWRIGRATIAALAAGRPLATHDARLGWMIVVATLPIVVAGLLFEDASVADQFRTVMIDPDIVISKAGQPASGGFRRAKNRILARASYLF